MPKDNPFSENPFNKPAGASPFLDDSVPQAAGYDAAHGSAWDTDSAVRTEPVNSWSASNKSKVYDAPATISANDAGLARRAEMLDLKERELRAKEAELKKVQDDLRRTGALRPAKNWPVCYPITHHDIAGEIPAAEQGMVRKAYWSFLAFVVCISYNFLGALIALCVIGPASGRLPAFFLAAVYWFAGVPGAWWLWYGRLYNAAIKDRAFTYAWFFLMYAVHLVFCLWSAVSPPLPGTNDWSHTGIISGIKAFQSSTAVGIIYIVGGVLWGLETLWSLWTIKAVYSGFRNSGGERRLRQEVASTVASHAATNAANRV